MTLDSISAVGYYPSASKKSDIPGRTSRICYADNDSVPPEKRGKEISDEDYERLQNTRLGNAKMLAARIPKPSTLKNIWNEVKSWFFKEGHMPNGLTFDDLCDNAQKAKDVYDAYNTITNQPPWILNYNS